MGDGINSNLKDHFIELWSCYSLAICVMHWNQSVHNEAVINAIHSFMQLTLFERCFEKKALFSSCITLIINFGNRKQKDVFKHSFLIIEKKSSFESRRDWRIDLWCECISLMEFPGRRFIRLNNHRKRNAIFNWVLPPPADQIPCD